MHLNNARVVSSIDRSQYRALWLWIFTVAFSSIYKYGKALSMMREMNLYAPEINASRGTNARFEYTFSGIYRSDFSLRKRRGGARTPSRFCARGSPFLILISSFRLNSFADVHRKWISAGSSLLAEGRSTIEDGRPRKDRLQRAYFRDVGCERGPRHVPVLRAERVRNGPRNCRIALRG